MQRPIDHEVRRGRWRRHCDRPSRSALIASCLAAVFSTLGSGSLAQAQTIFFEELPYAASEGALVRIVIGISSPPENRAVARFTTEDGSAIGGQDYTEDSRILFWPAGDGASRILFIPILDDDDVEATESFRVRLTEPVDVDLGDPSTALVSIEDNDVTPAPRAFVDTGDAIPNRDGEYYLFAEAGEEIGVQVQVTEVENFPVRVDWESDFAPFTGTLFFEAAVPQVATLTVPQVGNGEAVLGSFSVGSPVQRAVRTSDTSSIGVAGFSLHDCVACMLYVALQWTRYLDESTDLQDCSPGIVRGKGVSDPLTTLRRYRDEVLSTTTGGQNFIRVFEEHSPAASRALLGDATLAHVVSSASGPWLDAFQAVLDGTGDSVVVTQTMVNDLGEVLDRLAAAGTPALSQAIDSERSRLGVDTLAGMTMNEFQERLDSTTPVVESTWSSVKERYRNR